MWVCKQTEEKRNQVFTSFHCSCDDIDSPVSFLNKGAFLDIVAKCEISRVLLLMLLEVSVTCNDTV